MMTTRHASPKGFNSGLANWIWAINNNAKGEEPHQLAYFRRHFQLPEAEAYRSCIHITASTRYKLYVNGQVVASGPSKGDRWTQYYETIDISHQLKPGDNVIAVQVLYFSAMDAGPFSLWRADKGGLLLEGEVYLADHTVCQALHSDEQWQAMLDHSTYYEVETWLTLFLGGVERVEGSQVPCNWKTAAAMQNPWPAAVVSPPLSYTDGHGNPLKWLLSPRAIPMLDERERTFKAIARADGAWDSKELMRFVTEPGYALTLAPHQSCWVELDAGELTTGYLQLSTSGGKESIVRLLCAESYEDVEEGQIVPEYSRKRVKGDRADSSPGRMLAGNSDHYRIAGWNHETYEPFWFRTFRFVRLSIEVGEEPLILNGLHYRETGYPLQEAAQFDVPDESLMAMWKVSLNTLKRCMHETYEDTPYYEQLQYIMDTQLMSIYTYRVSGDDRLARQAIYAFHSSSLPSGLLQSRYPSQFPQIIPGFSLYWIFMICDHYDFFGDLEIVRRYRSTIDGILDWFDRSLAEDGFVHNDDRHWNYFDWVEGWEEGVIPASRTGPNAAYSLLYIKALQRAAKLCRYTGRQDTAAEYEHRAGRIIKAIKETCWNEERGLFQDGPACAQFSQHIQVWCILTGIAEGHDAKKLMKRTIQDETLSQMSFSMSYYLFRALSQTELYGEANQLWQPWRDMLGLHLTSWAEAPNFERSDCHGWGAIMLSEFVTEIIGVTPGLPGYARIKVKPNLLHLPWAKGRAVTPHGPVDVHWMRSSGQFHIKVQGPAHIPIEVIMPDGTMITELEAGIVEAQCKISEEGGACR